jgi:acetyl esterase/lipase
MADLFHSRAVRKAGDEASRRPMRRRRRRFSPTVVDALERRTLSTAGLIGGVSVARHHHRQTPGDADQSAAGGRAYLNLPYTTRNGQPQSLDLHLPPGTPPAGGWPIVLALPGGGWRWVRRQDLEGRADVLTQYGFAVATADYAYGSSRIGSKIWPLNFQDVQDAVRWLRAKSSRYSLNPNQVAALGESAGGHLAALLGTIPNEPAGTNPIAGGSADQLSARVQAVVDLYGPTNLAELYGQSAKDQPFLSTFLGGAPDLAPADYQAASPALNVSPNDPPFLILQGTGDTAVPFTQSVELASALTAAGAPNRLMLLQGETHGFWLTGPNRNLLPDVVNFLHQAFSGGPITS